MNRRELLKLSASSFAYVVGSQLFFGEKVSAAVKKAFETSNGMKFIQELPDFDGIYIFDPQQLTAYGDDFGHSIHKIPLGVLKPDNARDIQKLNQFCYGKKLKVTMRGIGGAAYGQTQLSDGIIIDSTSMKSIRWISEDLVELDPGLVWHEVLEFTIQKNRTPPVMPDTIVTSVGGKANVGGIGETSYQLGAIVDQIVEFDLVSADGSLYTCHPHKNQKLFHAALGSMGQFGMMVRLVMKTMPAPAVVWTRQFKIDGRDYSFMKDLAIIAENEPNGAIGGHFVRNKDGKTFTYVLDVTAWSEENPAWLSKINIKQEGTTKPWSFYEYAHRNTKGWNDAVASGAAFLPHPYMSFYLPWDRCQEMSEYLQTTDMANFGAGRMMFVPLLADSFGNTSFMLPNSKLIGHFRIYRIPRTGENGPDHQNMIAHNQNEIVPKVFQMGGKVYLPFSPLLNRKQVQEHFENSHMRFMERLKERLDPNNLLNTGAGLF